MQDSTRLKYSRTCPDCSGADFVEDHAAGDLICTVCVGATRRRDRERKKKNRNAFRPRLPPRRRPPHTYNALSLLSSPSQGCGLVVEGHAIDERSEWRTFGDGVRRGREEETRGEEARPLARACPLTST